MRWLFWTLLVAMAGVYLTMLIWSLPHLSELAQGRAMFDLRPGGYVLEEARVVLGALGAEGRGFYLDVQHKLDTVYPALFAAVLVMSFLWVYPRKLAIGLSAIAISAAAFDYLENAAVAVMLRAGPAGLGEAMATTASRWTVLKSGAVSVALTALLIGLVLAGWRKWRRVRAPQRPVRISPKQYSQSPSP